MGLFDLFRKSSQKAVKVAADKVEVKGKVIANLLNVRQKPSLRSKVVGQLRRNAIVKILNELDDWYEILWGKNNVAYVYKKYVVIIAYIKRGTVLANILNVRERPSLDARILGRLQKGAIVYIVEDILDWYGIEFYGYVAYVAKKYVETQDLPPIGGEQAFSQFFSQRKDLFDFPLEPDYKAKGSSDAAKLWNKYGGLVKRLSQELAIDPAVPMAVFLVEAGGRGFDEKKRLIIRFEAHVFKKFLVNDELFNKYFKIAGFRHQQWYDPDLKQWVKLHDGTQDTEWKVFTFARKLNEEAALKAISMGMAQIMGFNYKLLGYDSVKQMFDKFSSNIRYHILGFFDFVKAQENLLTAMQRKNFYEIAVVYNGPGQAATYAKILRSRYHEFKRLV